jgi:hypothetical protein
VQQKLNLEQHLVLTPGTDGVQQKLNLPKHLILQQLLQALLSFGSSYFRTSL